MMVVTQVILVDASALTPRQLIATATDHSRWPPAVPAPFISLPCAPGLYGMSPLDGPVRVGAVSLSAHPPKGGVHDPGVKELGRGVGQVNDEPGRWWAVIFTRCQVCAHWEADAWASGLLVE